MDIEGEYVIDAEPDAVWSALNDLETLKRCIPGCEIMEEVEPDRFECVVLTKIGPVKARFKSVVTLTNINPPHSYTLVGEGRGGAAGFGKGSADVALTPNGQGTQLNYTAKVMTGGKLAQLGSRLLLSTTRKLADQFFEAFRAGFDANTQT